MATIEDRDEMPQFEDPEAVRVEWLRDLNALASQVNAWIEPAGWRTHDTNLGIRAIDLLNTIGAASTGRAFSKARREQVHEVRRYRNSLVHERDDPTPPVAISEATRRLNSFLGAKLPEH